MKKLRFVQISDIHLLDNKNDKLHNIDISKVFSEILKSINKIKPKIDFILLSGDVSENGSVSSYINAKEILSSIRIPVFWIPGNHDDLCNINILNNDLNISPLKSFVKNDINFILLNSVAFDNNGINRSRGFLSSNELQFLKNELQNNISKINIIALHHPPIKSGTWKDERMLENSDSFFELINQFDNVSLVIFGHQHQSAFKKIGNVFFYSPPAASYQFDKIIKWGFDNKPPGFGVISILNDGNIRCEDYYLDIIIRPVFNSKQR